MDCKRKLQMLNLLRDGNTHKIEQIESTLGVGNRLARKSLKELDEEISNYGAGINVKRGDGYYLQINVSKTFEEYEQKLRREQKEFQKIPEEPDRRVWFLTGVLLRADTYRKIDDLCEQLYTSRRAMTEELKKVRQILSRYDLQLESKPNYGVKIIGRESALRRCIADCNTDWIELIPSQAGNKGMSRIADIVLSCLEEGDIKVSDIALQNLTMHIYIAVERIINGHCMPESETEKKILEQKEYAAAKRISEKLEKEWQLEFPVSETEYIAAHLAGKRLYEEDGKSKNLVVTEEVSTIMLEMLQSIYDSFQMDFRKDLELQMALSQHLVPLIIRIQHGMKLQNPLLQEIKEQFSFAYVMADQACSVLAKKYQTTLRDDEVGYIALALALALERKKHKRVKKNVLLVCSTGKGSSRLLQYQYQEKFGEYLNQIQICDSKNLDKIDFSRIDYVFTTVPLDTAVPVPVLKVGFFIKEKETQIIRKALSEEKNFKLDSYFPQTVFFKEIEVENKEDVLKFLCKKAVEAKLAPEELYAAVTERERIANTNFGNLAAMPHPNYSVSEKTFAAVAILKKEISWGNRKVRVVFLVSVAKKAEKEIQLFYQTLSRFLLNEGYINGLIRRSEYGFLMECMHTLEEEIENGGV